MAVAENASQNFENTTTVVSSEGSNAENDLEKSKPRNDFVENKSDQKEKPAATNFSADTGNYKAQMGQMANGFDSNGVKGQQMGLVKSTGVGSDGGYEMANGLVVRNGEDESENFKREMSDMRDLEELLSKLNPLAEEFVPPSLANNHGYFGAGGFGYANNFVLTNFGNANGLMSRRRKNGYIQGKRRMNGRMTPAQREAMIRRTVYVSDIDQQVTEEQLAALFLGCGQVVDCRVCGDPNSILRFAFIEFTDEAFVFGILIGWVWKPRWAIMGSDKLSYSVSKAFDLSFPSSPLASVMSPLNGLRSKGSEAWTLNTGEDKTQSSAPPNEYEDCSMLQPNEQKPNLVNKEDLEHLCQLVEMKDGGPPWKQMMDRSAPNMSYKAWQRDPKHGPPQYRSSTIFEDATPELVRDFFWDDEFRSNWDDMLASSTTIEECPTTGTMIVQWIRKFPFFCKDREYIIGRRIWESGRSYYCVTKGVPCTSVPRRDTPRRVDLYYSSWCIRAVESKRGNGQLTACEVLLLHYEDMGIPWELAKLGIRKGMWGAVKKIEPGFRAYQKARASGAPLSRPAFMAQINSKIGPEYLRFLGDTENLSETQIASTSDKPSGRNIPKLLIFGGAIILACSLDRGLLTKAVIFGVARRFGNIGNRL